ncbi:MAG: undecaprenyl-phosphate glucose phosphotransferase [Frankiales bacterium]|nr:undecaprenyl-phosphate glucose phosphotransferase [Frankiales bacterium]
MSTLDEGRIRLPFMRPPREAEAEAPAATWPAPPPLPIRVLAEVHSGARSAVAVLVDMAVLALSAVSVRDRSAWSVALFVSLALVLSGRVYRDRDRVVARGVAWWPAVLMGPVAVGILADVLLMGHSVTRTTVAGVAGLAGLVFVRAVSWCVISVRRRSDRDLAGALVVGNGDRAQTLARTLDRHREIGLSVHGHIDSSVLADPRWLAQAIAKHRAAHVFLVPAEGIPSPPALRRALGLDVHISYVPLVSDALLDSRPAGRLGGVAVLPLGRPLRGPTARRGKRAADVLFGSLLLLLTSPLLALAALAVWLDDRGPVLYRQYRTGLGGSQFPITKFRTMRRGADAEEAGLTSYNTSDGLLFKMRHDPRVTRAGRLLRRTGIDELPQLFDVLRGRMSLVGPRPLPVESGAFSERDAERHLVRPGMTGLWQVSGGSTLRYREMIDLDLAYVHSWGPWLDVQIALATISVLARATVGREGHER